MYRISLRNIIQGTHIPRDQKSQMERHIVQGYIVPFRHTKIFRKAGKRTTLYLGISSLKKRSEFRLCYGAVAGGRLELRPPVESSDLDEKVFTSTPVRDTSSVGIWVESYSNVESVTLSILQHVFLVLQNWGIIFSPSA
jgi:hypothetical protein